MESRNGTDEAEKLRDRVVDELVQTEKTYVQCLHNLIHCFMIPLRQPIHGKRLLSQSEHATIFPSDINTIHAFHSTLLMELIQTSQIGHIFVKYGQMFKMYQTYMNNHHHASHCLSQIMSKNTKFAAWCKKTSADKCNNCPLNSLLILPIQRIPRYQLLIQELMKRTEQYDIEHDDLSDLRNAYDIITQVTQCINDRMKENDRRQKVGYIQAQFDRSLIDKLGSDLVIPARYFVAESSKSIHDEDYIIKHNKHGKQTAIVLFVFNDCMIYGHYDARAVTISSKRQLKALDSVKTLLFSRELLKFDHMMRFDELFQLEDVAPHEYNNLFCIKIYAREHSLWVSFKTKQCKYKWMTQLVELNDKANSNRSIIKQNKPPIDIPYPLFVPDDYSDCCLICKQKFGLLTRRHHCYYCGTLACSKCTDCSLRSMWKTNEIVRVCSICHITYKDKHEHPHLNLPMNNRASIWEASVEMDSKLVPMLSPNISPERREQITKAQTPPPITSGDMGSVLGANQSQNRHTSFRTRSKIEMVESKECDDMKSINHDEENNEAFEIHNVDRMCCAKQQNVTQNLIIIGGIVVIGIALIVALKRRQW